MATATVKERTPMSSAEVQYFAKGAYQAYGAVTDWKNFQGNPMPAYEDLPDQIKQAWEAASQYVVDEVIRGLKPPRL